MKVIVEITDEIFGKNPIPFNNPIIRNGARGIVKRRDGLIAIVNKVKKNEYKLPGGGIEENETPESAFRREVLEETGCEIHNIKLLGITKELKSLDNFQQVSYVFCSEVKKINKNLELTQKEKDEGVVLTWLSKEEALEKISNCEKQIKESEYENLYHSKFINYRDKEILKYYISNNYK